MTPHPSHAGSGTALAVTLTITILFLAAAATAAMKAADTLRRRREQRAWLRDSNAEATQRRDGDGDDQ